MNFGMGPGAYLSPSEHVQREILSRSRTGIDRARDAFGADEVSDITELSKHFKLLAKSASYVYTDVPTQSSHPAHPSPVATLPIRKTVLSYLNRPTSKTDYERVMGVLSKSTSRSLSDVVAKFRKTKSPAEQLLMRQAADISGTAHAKALFSSSPCSSCLITHLCTQTMRFGNQAKTEAQLAAHFEYLCARAGAQRPAYVPVVACGWVKISASTTLALGDAHIFQFERPDNPLHQQRLSIESGRNGAYGRRLRVQVSGVYS